MQKIIIIGPSGAGKTTLARQIAGIINVPHYELDSFYHLENWHQADAQDFRTKVFTLAAQDGWIFCGNYFSKLGIEFWRKPDMLIWCDYPLWLVLPRLVRRTLRRAIRKETLWNNNTESLLKSVFTKDSVIFWMLSTWRAHKKRHHQLFLDQSQFPGVQLIRLRHPRQANRLLETLIKQKSCTQLSEK